jgi:hypothetical protein
MGEGGPGYGRHQAGDGGSEQPTARNVQDTLPAGMKDLRPSG